MGTTQVIQTYANNEFVSGSSNPNPAILSREISQLSLSEQPSSVHKSGTDMKIQWNNALPTAADIALIDGAVAVHLGGTTIAATVRQESEGVSTNSTDTPETKLSLTTQQLLPGTYEVVWYGELAMDAELPNSQGEFTVVINGVTEFTEIVTGTYWRPVTGTNFVDVLSGDTITIELSYRKTGVTPNMAMAQKVRASIKPLNS